MIHKDQSNKLIKDLAALSEVLAIAPGTEVLIKNVSLAHNDLPKMGEASLEEYI